MGRPRIIINKELFEDLCNIQCTRDEICSCLKASKDTLIRWCKREYHEDFETIYKKLTENGKSSLRRAMYKKAMVDGSVPMMIFLSKNLLGMRDAPSMYDDANNAKPVQIVYTCADKKNNDDDPNKQ